MEETKTEDGFSRAEQEILERLEDMEGDEYDCEDRLTDIMDTSRSGLVPFDGLDSLDVPNAHNNTNEEEVKLESTSPLHDKVLYLLKNATPVIASFFMSNTGNFILMMYAGHHKPKQAGLKMSTVFAGISMANMYCNVSFRSLIIGMTGAVETLGSQNNGAGNYRNVGIVLQRSIFVLACVSLLSVFLWLHAEQIFLLINIDPAVCKVIGVYVKIRILEMPFSCINESYEKYLMSIGCMWPPMLANLALNISVAIFCALFLYGFELEYWCMAMAWVLSVIVAGVTMIRSSWNVEEVKRTRVLVWNWADVLNWEELKRFIFLGIPGTAMLCSEWWAYEVLTVFAGLLGTNEVSAWTIIVQTGSLVFMIPLGLSVTIASIVGNSLGAGKRDLAVQMADLALMFIVLMAVVVGTIIFFVGAKLGLIFTNDNGVLAETAQVVPYLFLFILFDGLQGVASGILRGCGQQTVGALTNLAAFYVFGVPSAWLLCFNAGLGVSGLMLGISMGTLVQSAVLMYLIKVKPDYIFQLVLGGDKESTSNTSCDSLDALAVDMEKATTVKHTKEGDYSHLRTEESTHSPISAHEMKLKQALE